MPSRASFQTHAEYLAYFAAYRQRNRAKLRKYKADYMKAYRAAGRDKSRAGKVSLDSESGAAK